MNVKHIIAVYKAEYFTTTSKFRAIRSYIPLIFILGVVLFSFVLRFAYDFFRGDTFISDPPVGTLFSIVTVFSYFTLFAPLLSPLGRVVYDGSDKSRREVALNSPVSNKDLLYGNLLSNLVFFLPFFSFIGTLSLAPFIGNGVYSPFLTSIFLFVILSLLITVGLVAGTFLSPLVYRFISAQQSNYARAFVTFAVAVMLVLSLPLLAYLLDTVNDPSLSVGIIGYLPFTLAANLIIYTLYGVAFVSSPVIATIFLVFYTLVIFAIGYFLADNLYGYDEYEKKSGESLPASTINKVISGITSPIPITIRSLTRGMIKASVRDIEHIARLTIGIAITIFMIFALSSRGLFRGVAEFPENVELAVIVFAIILSSASVVFIEGSAFVVQHRNMFTMLKSAPNGPWKFIISKFVQMFYIFFILFFFIIVGLSQLDIIAASNIVPILVITILGLVVLISISIVLFMINPADNQEDLVNFINLLIFYVFAFMLAIIPIVILLLELQLSISHIFLAVSITLMISIISLVTATYALEKMDVETLHSDFSQAIHHVTRSALLFFFGWIIVPLFSIPYFIQSGDLTGLLLIQSLFTVILPLLYYIQKYYRTKPIPVFTIPETSLRTAIITLMSMLVIGIIIQLIYDSLSNNQGLFVIDLEIGELVLLLLLGVLTEEIFFRGLLIDYSSQRLRNTTSIVLASIFFASVHFATWGGMINAFIQGLLLGRLRLRTSIYHTIIVHLVYNIIILVIFNL